MYPVTHVQSHSSASIFESVWFQCWKSIVNNIYTICYLIKSNSFPHGKPTSYKFYYTKKVKKKSSKHVFTVYLDCIFNLRKKCTVHD